MSGLWSLYNQGGSGGPPPPQLRGRLVYVDSRYGNNSTAQVERADRPFATIEAAFNAALAAATGPNDPYTIHVRPGRYLLTPNQMVKPANRTIHFEFENEVQLIVDAASNPFPPNSAWLQILGGPVIINGWGSLNIVASLSQESCLFRLPGAPPVNQAFLRLYCNQIQSVYAENNASFIRFAGIYSIAIVHANRIINNSSSEGQAFIRCDIAGPQAASLVYVYEESIGMRMFYDSTGSIPKDHRFYSRFHRGSIGGLTATDSPIQLTILAGTRIQAEGSPLAQPLGLRPQSIIIDGDVYVNQHTLFISDVLADSNLGYSGRTSSSVTYTGLSVGTGFYDTMYINRFTHQGGQVDARYHAATFGLLPPGSSVGLGWLINNQLIRGFYARALPGYGGAARNIAFGTLNLGPLTAFFPANTITNNGIDIPLSSGNVGAAITSPTDRLAVFASSSNTGNAINNGDFIIGAYLGKAL
jgi:hypothetical protein